MKQHLNAASGLARTFVAVAATLCGLAGCGGGSGDDDALSGTAEKPASIADATALQTTLADAEASPPSSPSDAEASDRELKARNERRAKAERNWLDIAGGIPAPVTTWNADPPGAYVQSVRAALANPPAGTSNAAHDQLAFKYPHLLRQLRATGIGASTLGNARVDDFADNSFDIGRYPEESLDVTSTHTYHKYGALTYLGPTDPLHGITKESVVRNVLIDRYGYPAWMLSPVPANFQQPSVAYAVSPVLAANPGNLAKADLYYTRIGVIEQVRVPDGVVNITTTDHTVYPGTTRRTIVEFEGGLFIYTTGSGVNRYNNSGQGRIPFRPGLTLLRDTYQSGYAFGNDNYGPPAFQALDQQAVKYLNAVRIASAGL